MLAVLLLSCGGAPKTAPEEPVRPRFPVAVNQTAKLPKADLVASAVSTGSLFGAPGVPPGTVANYEKGNQHWKIGVADAGDAAKAAVALSTWKDALPQAKFVPGFGGYFANSPSGPVFVFTKNNWILAIQGLPQAEADALARTVAVRF
jgi:hypothetical protein